MPQVTLTVNGQTHTAEVEGRTLLVELLREKLRMTGTHVGCDTSQCGACNVLIDGAAVKACTMLAASRWQIRKTGLICSSPNGQSTGIWGWKRKS